MLGQGGIDFSTACNRLIDNYGSLGCLWYSWGDYDRTKFQQQCKDFGVSYPFSNSHVNLKALFANLKGNKHECGLGRAIKSLGWQFHGRPHSGVDDALNVARILIYILEKVRKGF